MVREQRLALAQAGFGVKVSAEEPRHEEEEERGKDDPFDYYASLRRVSMENKEMRCVEDVRRCTRSHLGSTRRCRPDTGRSTSCSAP